MKAYENLALIKGWMESPEFFPNAFVSQFLHKQLPSAVAQATTICSLKTAGALDYQDLYNLIEAGVY